MLKSQAKETDVVDLIMREAQVNLVIKSRNVVYTSWLNGGYETKVNK